MKIFYFLQHFLLGKRRSNVNLLQSSKLFAAFVLKTEFTEWACLCVSTNASVSVSRCAVAIEIAGGQHDNKHAACHLFISTYLHIYISTYLHIQPQIPGYLDCQHTDTPCIRWQVCQWRDSRLKMTIDYDEILTHIGELGNLKSNVVENAENLWF